MPLGCRNIEPVCLGAHKVPQSTEKELKCVHLTVANNAIVGALLQLSSLVRHADDLFCDISDECQKVFERTDILTKKIRKIGDDVGKLDAKQVKVPEGDLKGFSAITTYYEARHGYDSHTFQPSTRPQCIQDQYNLCQTNPVRVIRSADLYRRDGLTGSKMFKCWPVILNEQTVRTPDMNLPRRVQRVRSFEKKYKKLKIRERPKTIHGWDDLSLQDSKNEMTEEKNRKASRLAESQPPVMVSIDTSGSNFERMQSMRLSGRQCQTKEEKEKKKRRRRTVTGVPENIVYEIERFEKKQKVRSTQRHTHRSYSFDDLDAEDNDIERDERIVKYLNEIDGKIEEREGEDKALKLMKFFPCRRARSLPRCVKLASVVRSVSAERKSPRDMNCSYASSSLSLASMVSSGSRLSRSTKRSSIISNKIKSFVTKDKPRQRPKSLDIDTLLDSKSKKKTDAKERSKSSYSLERSDTPRVPDNLLSKQLAQTSESSMGPGTYYNFESSTLPRAQAKKYDFPWESLPKDWTTSVKLREISKRRAREDRQSSSGNWSQSGTSSNRQSLDSDIRGEGYKCASQYSLGKDSGRDSLTLDEEYDCVTDGTSTAGYAGDETSTIAGSSDSVSVGNPKSDFTDSETQAWLQTLAVRAANRVEITSKDADALTSLSRLTRKNILALDLMLSDDKTQRKITDEESSIYSVDQEGFYTSFHNDSGLKKSTNTLVDEDLGTPVKDSPSVCSADSVILTPTSADKFAALQKGNSASQSKVLSKVTPPTPPTRLSSNKTVNASVNTANNSASSDTNRSNVSDNSDTYTPPQLHSFPSVESSISESDQEAVFARVKDKTRISSTSFPTLVALSTSEEDTSPDTSSEKLRRTKLTSKGATFTLGDTECGIGDLSALSNTDDTSRFSLFSNGSVVERKSASSSSSETELRHSKSALECTDQGYDSLNLPKRSRNTSKSEKKTEASYQSWPRSHKSSPGILKTPEKPNGPLKAPKTLNFAPVINLFKPGMPNSVQMPLPSPTNSSYSEGNSSSMLNTSSFKSAVSPEPSYKLAYPLEASDSQSKMNAVQQSELPMKYQPVITVTPRSRSGDRQTSDRSGGYVKLTPESTRTPIYATSNAKPTAQSTPYTNVTTNKTSPNLYAVSPVMAAKESTNQNGHVDSGYMDMDKAIALTSMGSFSSLVSSDINFGDNSTYMSMSSPCSSPNLSNMDFPMTLTPCGSVDSLSDLRRTPTNGLENDTYQINTSIQGNVYNPASSGVETVPVVTDSYTASGRLTQNGGGQKSVSSFTAVADISTNSSANNSYSSFGSSKTHSRRSFNETNDSDLTKVTRLSQLSTPGSSMKCGGNTSEQTPRPRASRADTRHEPSYRSNVQANRRSLPSDASHSIYGNNPKLVGLKDNVLPNKMPSPKGMTCSRSYPSGIGSAVNPSYKPATPASYAQGRGTNHGKHIASPVTPTAEMAPISSRSDSYRVALNGVNKRHGSPGTGLPQSKSTPVFPLTKQSGPYRVAMDMNSKITADDDVMARADSYRIAVRNTNGLVTDVANRNTSYRVAVNDALSAINAKIATSTSINQKSPSTGHETKRMGYNNTDKVKGVSNKALLKETKSAPLPQSQSMGRIRRVTKTDVDPIQILSSMDYNRNDTRKSDKNNQNRSSTYIQFDPIFEDTEDFTNSTESLRIASLKSPMLDTVSQSSTNKSPMTDSSSRSSSRNQSLLKPSAGKSKHSLMNGNARDSNSTIRTVKSSKSGRPIEIEDNWRYSQV